MEEVKFLKHFQYSRSMRKSYLVETNPRSHISKFLFQSGNSQESSHLAVVNSSFLFTCAIRSIPHPLPSYSLIKSDKAMTVQLVNLYCSIIVADKLPLIVKQTWLFISIVQPFLVILFENEPNINFSYILRLKIKLIYFF